MEGESSESEDSDFVWRNDNDVAVAAAELLTGADWALADVELSLSSESEDSNFSD